MLTNSWVSQRFKSVCETRSRMITRATGLGNRISDHLPALVQFVIRPTMTQAVVYLVAE